MQAFKFVKESLEGLWGSVGFNVPLGTIKGVVGRCGDDWNSGFMF